MRIFSAFYIAVLVIAFKCFNTCFSSPNYSGSKWRVIWDLAFEGRNIKRSEQTQINLHHKGILGVWELSTTFISMQIEKDSLKMLF